MLWREELHREEEGGSHCLAFLLGIWSQEGPGGPVARERSQALGEASSCPHPVQAAAALALSLGS